MALQFDSISSGRLTDPEIWQLMNLGFKEDTIKKFSDSLVLADFHTVRDLFEITGMTVGARVPESDLVEQVLSLLKAIGRGSTAIPLTECPEENNLLSYDTVSGDSPLLVFTQGNTEYLCFRKHYKASQKLGNGPSGGSLFVYNELLKLPCYCDEQKKVIRDCPGKGLYIVTGGPGTGKTTVVSGILYSYLKGGGSPDDIALAAPTGRAAARMKESVAGQFSRLDNDLNNDFSDRIAVVNPSTLHSLLKYRQGDTAFDAKNPLPYKLIIVDEFSMTDLSMAAALFDAVSDEALLILVGDPDQLPSVEAGNVLKQLLEAYPEQVGKLQENHRSQKNIKNLKDEVNNYAPGGPLKFSGTFSDNTKALFDDWKQHCDDTEGYTCSYFTSDSYGAAVELGDKWFEFAYTGEFYKDEDTGKELSYIGLIKEISKCIDYEDINKCGTLLRLLFEAVNKFKLLCCIREGVFGCSRMNDRMESMLKEKLSKEGGIPIMITRNDRSNNLYNGDIGVLIKDRAGSERALFESDTSGEFRCFPLSALPDWEKAFAITVHKSQGSEYEHELILIPEADNNSRLDELLCGEILYTAVTRAKKSLCIAGSREALEKAAGHKLNRTGIPVTK